MKSVKPQARALAALVLSKALTRRQTLSALLPDYLDRLSAKKDRAFLQELCFGVMRYFFLLEFILARLLEKPLKAKDSDIKMLLLTGLYQEIFLRTPPHAVVSATVETCDELRKPWAKNLTNALLRRYQRESKDLLAKVENDLPAKYAHPRWLLERLRQDHPDAWREICLRNNEHPPMYLRVNTRKTSRAGYLTLLENNGIDASSTPFSSCGIKLGQPRDVNDLPEFRHGHVSVQDLSAQLTAQLLDPQPGQRLLDACAAPGGKLGHLLEHEPQLGEAVAVESDGQRCVRLQQTLDRLQLEATVIQADARATQDWWDGTGFDRILLDAPCSATGVIRRHPDIKVLRTPEDVDAAVVLQQELLAALWPLLKPGGRLLYVTCSILTCENDGQIARFLDTLNNATSLMINADWGTMTCHGRQILPGQDDMDGFYYACLQKS